MLCSSRTIEGEKISTEPQPGVTAKFFLCFSDARACRSLWRWRNKVTHIHILKTHANEVLWTHEGDISALLVYINSSLPPSGVYALTSFTVSKSLPCSFQNTHTYTHAHTVLYTNTLFVWAPPLWGEKKVNSVQWRDRDAHQWRGEKIKGRERERESERARVGGWKTGRVHSCRGNLSHKWQVGISHCKGQVL